MSDDEGDPGTRVLLISTGAWRDDNNSGSTRTNLFGAWPSENIAQIYCSHEQPANPVCRSYFQISDRMLLRSILTRRSGGSAIHVASAEGSSTAAHRGRPLEGPVYGFLRRYRSSALLLVREMLWSVSAWRSRELESYIHDFSPDVLFVSLCDSVYLNRLIQHVAATTGKPLALFCSDDVFADSSGEASVIRGAYRRALRKAINETVGRCDRLYVISHKQKEEYDSLFAVESRVLFKGGNFASFGGQRQRRDGPLRLVFAGNITSGRWRTLAEIGTVLRRVNAGGVKARLHIYTHSPLTRGMRMAMDIPGAVAIEGGVPSQQVRQTLLGADILVHVESFELRDRIATRLSFSTKLVDYFESGRCIFAVGWDQAASIEYLVRNDAAVVATRSEDVEPKLRALIDSPQLILDYGRKAWECGRRNHQLERIRDTLYRDLFHLANMPPKSAIARELA